MKWCEVNVITDKMSYRWSGFVDDTANIPARVNRLIFQSDGLIPPGIPLDAAPAAKELFSCDYSERQISFSD